MTDTAKKPRTPRAKQTGPRAFVVRNGESKRLITADEVRAATPADLLDALSGKIQSEPRPAGANA